MVENNNTETTAVTESAPARNVHTPTPDSYTVDCGCDRLFELTKELFIKYNLNDKESHANNSLNEYLKRNGLKSEEELYSILFVS